MSNFHEAADAIRRISKTLDGFRIAAEALDQIASVDQAAKEAQAACAAAVKERSDEVAKLAKAKADVKSAQAKSEQIVLDAQDKASALTVKAEADAKTSAQVIFDGIVAQADAIESASKAAADKLASQIEYNSKVAAGLKDEVEQLDDAITIKQAQLDDLTAALDALKSKLA